MDPNPDRINQLLQRLESLSRQQELFSKEIYALRNELYLLKSLSSAPIRQNQQNKTAPQPPADESHEIFLSLTHAAK